MRGQAAVAIMRGWVAGTMNKRVSGSGWGGQAAEEEDR